MNILLFRLITQKCNKLLIRKKIIKNVSVERCRLPCSKMGICV